jgi:chemotaxis protein methyltransferase CheR
MADARQMTAAPCSSSFRPAPSAAAPGPDPIYRQIRDLVYKVSGIYKPEEKIYLLADGCARRMNQLKLRTARDYWDCLTATPFRDAELRELLNEITIGETCLFRSLPQLDALRKVILPEFISDKARQITKRLRIWSAGCSTGEEPYTLAMSLLEDSAALLKDWKIEILATDLNDRSIEAAKTGIYGDYALRFTTDSFKRKYFSPVDQRRLQVRPEVKNLVAFSRLNLQDDSRMLFMKGMDIIFCCNVLIYFDATSKTKVINHFFSNLNFGGYFFLGASESLMNLSDQFHLVHFPSAIGYWKPSLSIGKL